MFSTLRIETGPIIDTAVEFETLSTRIIEAVDKLGDAKRAFLMSTAGAASSAAVADFDFLETALLSRAGKLTRNAKVLRDLTTLYNEADLNGARSFGG